MKRYIRVYKDKQGILKIDLGAGFTVFVGLIFIVIPFLALVDLVERLFRKPFFITEEDYYKEKLKELKDGKL